MNVQYQALNGVNFRHQVLPITVVSVGGRGTGEGRSGGGGERVGGREEERGEEWVSTDQSLPLHFIK